MAKNIVDTKALERDLKRTVKKVAQSAKSRLLTPTSTWENKPEFTIQEIEEGGNLVNRVSTDHAPYFFLDGGTNIRHAAMSKPFIPKTTPRSFVAQPGQGRVVKVSRKINLPGITARAWSEMTALEYSAVLQQAVDELLAREASGKKLFSITRRIHGVIDE